MKNCAKAPSCATVIRGGRRHRRRASIACARCAKDEGTVALARRRDVPSPAEKLSLSDEEWRRRLEPMQYAVLREEETERAFTSPLDDNHEAGVYLCLGCGLPLFSSEMKFGSGTGWPSFFTTIPDAFETKLDFVLFLPRTEYHCARCGGHHGHVFKDGPPPTYERWCNNGVALEFVAAKG